MKQIFYKRSTIYYFSLPTFFFLASHIHVRDMPVPFWPFIFILCKFFFPQFFPPYPFPCHCHWRLPEPFCSLVAHLHNCFSPYLPCPCRRHLWPPEPFCSKMAASDRAPPSWDPFFFPPKFRVFLCHRARAWQTRTHTHTHTTHIHMHTHVRTHTHTTHIHMHTHVHTRQKQILFKVLVKVLSSSHTQTMATTRTPTPTLYTDPRNIFL